MTHQRAGRVSALLAALLLLGAPGSWAPASASVAPWDRPASDDAPSTSSPAAASGEAVDAAAELAAVFTPTLSEPVAPGVSRRGGALPTGTGTQVVQLIDVDPSTRGIRLETTRPAGGVHALETVRDQAARVSSDGHRVVAVINGDVFSTDDVTGNHAPIGLQVHNGQLVTGGRTPHPTIGVDASGVVRVGDTTVATSVLLPSGNRLPVNRVNKPRQPGQLILYSRMWGSSTRSPAGGVEVVLSGTSLVLRPSGTWTATVVSAGRRRDAPIPAGGLVLSATGTRATALEALRPGNTVSIRTIATPGWEDVREAMGGREWLVRDGATSISPVTSVTTAAHPRTAVGLRANGTLVFAVVDGREYGYSVGVTAAELAALLRAEGAVQAIMLDGGGSSTVLARRPGDVGVTLLNKPSDGRERRVASGLAVVSTIPTGSLAALIVRPAGATALVGQSVPLVAKGVDDALNAVTSATPVTWSVAGSAGTVTTTGVFNARSPGTAVVTATSAALAADAKLTVVPDTTPPVPAAPVVRIQRGATVPPDGVPVTIGWGATDTGSGVASYGLRRRLDGIAWQDVGLPSPTTRSIARLLPLTRAIQYQVQATDRAANTSAWRSGAAFHVRLASERAAGTSYHGTWSTPTGTDYLGGGARSAKAA
ncbi:MAG: phosphodiester glycosidase family protein, partial [Chloroflexota bacterium]